MILFPSEQKNDIIHMVESRCTLTLTGPGAIGDTISIEFEVVSLSPKFGDRNSDREIHLERVKKYKPIRLPDEFPQF